MTLKEERGFQVTPEIGGYPSALGYYCDKNCLEPMSDWRIGQFRLLLTAMLKRANVEVFAS